MKREKTKTETRAPNLAARLLTNALEDRAFVRSHSAKQLAAALGVHASHWFRLRRDPTALARCQRRTLEAIARYLNWPIGRVLLASGTLNESDFEIVINQRDAIEAALRQIERGPFGSGLRTKLRLAAQDHQRLIADLYSAAQRQAIRTSTKAV